MGAREDRATILRSMAARFAFCDEVFCECPSISSGVTIRQALSPKGSLAGRLVKASAPATEAPIGDVAGGGGGVTKMAIFAQGYNKVKT